MIRSIIYQNKLLLVYTEDYVLLGFVFGQLFIPRIRHHVQNLCFSSLSLLSSS